LKERGLKREVKGEKGDRLLFFHRFFPYKHNTPLSFEKRGCGKAVHVSLLVDKLKGFYNVVLNIHLKFKRKYN